MRIWKRDVRSFVLLGIKGDFRTKKYILTKKKTPLYNFVYPEQKYKGSFMIQNCFNIIVEPDEVVKLKFAKHKIMTLKLPSW